MGSVYSGWIVSSMGSCLFVYLNSLLHLQQLNVEGQLGIGRDDTGMSAAAVGVVRRADQLGTLSNGPGTSSEQMD